LTAVKGFWTLAQADSGTLAPSSAWRSVADCQNGGVVVEFEHKLALHTWTLDTTPLAEALAVIRTAGWDAIELRRIDFTRCFDAGMTNAQVLDLVRASGLKVAVIGTEYGLIFAQGDERARLLDALDQTCANAVALGCDMVMIAPGQNEGTLETAAANFRAGGEIAMQAWRSLAEKGYPGYLSYEAPNPAQWSRPALEVAREGVEATRALLRYAA
jgi:sugar phosphate isomerase/epimerase